MNTDLLNFLFIMFSHYMPKAESYEEALRTFARDVNAVIDVVNARVVGSNWNQWQDWTDHQCTLYTMLGKTQTFNHIRPFSWQPIDGLNMGTTLKWYGLV